jgi:hypothetical protein
MVMAASERRLSTNSVPDRRRFGHVNVVCVYSTVMLYWHEEGESGRVQGGDSGMRQLTLSKGPERMGIRNRVREPPFQGRGFPHLNNPLNI